MIAAHIIVQGMVQGVGFRMLSQQKATQLGLNGWVKNLPNGDVELIVEGDSDKIDQFISFLKQGPNRFAKVDEVKVQKSGDLEGYNSFEIKG